MALVISARFETEFDNLPRSVKKDVYNLIRELSQESSTNLHIQTVRGSKKFVTARINSTWRAVLLRTDQPDSFVLLRALPHDDAYTWVKNNQDNLPDFSSRTLSAERFLAIDVSERRPPRWSIAGFSDDSPIGPDQLGISEDVEALASLLAARSLVPPLALALYGEWGSGKTFFMRSLDDAVTELSTYEPRRFCASIKSVWFNAWHYAEGNLWASLIHHIFKALHGANSADDALRSALADLETVKDATAQAQRRAAVAESAVHAARHELDKQTSELASALEDAEELTGRDLLNQVRLDEELRSRLKQTCEALGLSDVGSSTRSLLASADSARDTLRRARFLAKAKRWYKSPLLFGMAVMSIVCVVGLFATPQLGQGAGIFTQLAGILGGAATWLNRQSARVRELLAPAEEVRATVDDRLAEVEEEHRGEVLKAKQRLDDAESRLTETKAKLDEAERRYSEARTRLDEFSGDHLLKKYLAERAGSADYDRYLGVVALAYRDLNDLSQHLDRARTDENAGTVVERIILYIDDLDRCPPDTVVRVLEAVHLLLAMPMFVVVLGVAPDWLAKSLSERQIGPTDYLDKIFQLTYELPRMTPGNCGNLLESAARSTRASVDDDRTKAQMGGGERHPSNPTERQMRRGRKVELLEVDDNEIHTIRLVAPLVSASPRRAKRFLNIYRVTKSRMLRDGPLTNDDSAVLATLMALAVGLPETVPSLLDRDDLDISLDIGDWLTKVQEIASGEQRRRLNEYLETGGKTLTYNVGHLLHWVPKVRRFAWPALMEG